MDKEICVLISLTTGRPIVPNKVPNFFSLKYVPSTYMYNIVLEVPMLQRAQHNSIIVILFLVHAVCVNLECGGADTCSDSVSNL